MEFQKEFSDYLEDLINQKLIEKVEKEKLINLPNILFMLNLKIPVYKEENNSIYFKSVHLDFLMIIKSMKMTIIIMGVKK